MGDTVTISGLKEFNKALRQVDKSLPRMTKDALNESADFLIGKSRPLWAKRTGRAVGSMKKRSSQKDVKIAYGGARARYAAWLDFGGRVGRKKSVYRTYVAGGRYLYPVLAKHRNEFVSIAEKGLIGVAKAAGLEIR